MRIGSIEKFEDFIRYSKQYHSNIKIVDIVETEFDYIYTIQLFGNGIAVYNYDRINKISYLYINKMFLGYSSTTTKWINKLKKISNIVIPLNYVCWCELIDEIQTSCNS